MYWSEIVRSYGRSVGFFEKSAGCFACGCAHIPIESVKAPFFYILASPWYLLLTAILTSMRDIHCGFVFPWPLVIVSVSPVPADHLHVLLEEMCIQVLCPFKKLSCVFFWCCLSSLYILDINPVIENIIGNYLQVFHLFGSIPRCFHFLMQLKWTVFISSDCSLLKCNNFCTVTPS